MTKDEELKKRDRPHSDRNRPNLTEFLTQEEIDELRRRGRETSELARKAFAHLRPKSPGKQ